jgi:hypothetical protein
MDTASVSTIKHTSIHRLTVKKYSVEHGVMGLNGKFFTIYGYPFSDVLQTAVG